MPRPLVIGYHLVWTIYGTWLPNDPRGSGSRTVESPTIEQLGDLHYGRKRVQPSRKEVQAFYARASSQLAYPVVRLNNDAIAIVAKAFADVIAVENYTCYACAIMPDHVHLAIRKHKHQSEEMAENLKQHSRKQLVAHSYADLAHPIWTAGRGWRTFLEHPDDVRRTIGYIERNPLKDSLPPQRWSFVTPYDGWPLHPGHSANSSYAKALRAVGKYPG